MSARRWLSDLGLGARMSMAGGRDGVIRSGLAAIGVGIGVVLLLLASSIPAMLHARSERAALRSEGSIVDAAPANAHTVLIARINDEYRGRSIRGRLVRADGGEPIVPPGVAALPRPGDMVVSPALERLLASGDGALLRERLPYRTVGVIADRGLLDPDELTYYAGSDRLTTDTARRADYFGVPEQNDGLDPVLTLLVLVIFVILLLPIGIFVATAVRFGSEHRDRRLAAVRLLGADSGMARRIAAGEALLTAGVGLVLGAVFFAIGRQFIGRLSLQQISVFPSDVRPSPAIAALIAVGVPVAAVAVTLVALRRVVVEPFGVVRRAGTVRRRLWWRILLPIAGLALVVPLAGKAIDSGSTLYATRLVIGMILLLVGVTAVLPWVVERVVRLLGGGFDRGVAWQLAIRRLQLDNTASVRAVNGIAVAAAGAIALQMFFFGIDDNYTRTTGADPSRAQAMVELVAPATTDPHLDRAVQTARGASPVVSLTSSSVAAAGRPDNALPLTVASCAGLAQLIAADQCAEGDVFLVPPPAGDSWWADPAPGTDTLLGDGGVHWRIPAIRGRVTGRVDPSGAEQFGLFATPSAVAFGATVVRRATFVRLDTQLPDVVEYLRNAAARADPLADVQTLQAIQEVGRFRDIRRGLFAGTVVTLMLIGASLLVAALEQLRDRRRLLAALAAFGTSRATLGWSVLWQTAVPIVLGLILAVAAGLGLGSVLLRMTDQPIVFNWPGVGGIAAVAAAVVFGVTALTLPALWRLVRPTGLRTE